MDAILMSLMAALNEGLLVNIYQRDTDDFYTGTVQSLGKTSVVVATYNEAGLADGAVLLAFAAIDQVEFAGRDLEDMKQRITIAQSEHFLTLSDPDTHYQFDAKVDLLAQLVTQAQANQAVMMVVLADDDQYLEGQVTAVAEDHFDYRVFNKFNYTDSRTMQIDFSDVLVVEFGGLDLFLERQLLGSALSHTKTAFHPNDGQLVALFKQAEASGTLLAVTPKDDEDQFFVGTVKAVNQTVVVLKLTDMAGQFGGYIAVRIQAIQSVTTDSDYLQTVAFYQKWDQAHDFAQQPVLNAEREFDASGDLMATLLHEAATFNRVVRIRRAVTDEHLTGLVAQANPEAFVLNLLDEDEGEQVTISYGDVLEIAFGHIYAYLQEAQAR